jgi:hypothetical protein
VDYSARSPLPYESPGIAPSLIAGRPNPVPRGGLIVDSAMSHHLLVQGTTRGLCGWKSGASPETVRTSRLLVATATPLQRHYVRGSRRTESA